MKIDEVYQRVASSPSLPASATYAIQATKRQIKADEPNELSFGKPKTCPVKIRIAAAISPTLNHDRFPRRVGLPCGEAVKRSGSI